MATVIPHGARMPGARHASGAPGTAAMATATATLHGARTYRLDGLVFTANEPVVVVDEVAEALAGLPHYFTVAFDGLGAGARRTPPPEAPAEPSVSI